LIACIGAAALYFWKGKYFWASCPCFLLVIYGLQSRSLLLDNRVTKFLSSISMEIYLCHMLFFKALQKLSLAPVRQRRCFLIVTSVMVIALAVAFSFLQKRRLRLFLSD
jgi:peptidoglycan/LPS O-acetylase OafA/YrhL